MRPEPDANKITLELNCRCRANSGSFITCYFVFVLYLIASTPVVPWLSYSPLNPRFADSNSAGVDGFFSERKNPEYDFLRKGSNVVGPVS